MATIRTIIYIIVLIPIIFFALCLVATQIMDIYEGYTGESWEKRIARKKLKAKEGRK